MALKHKVINKAVWGSLKQFLVFRHFFSHAYAFHLEFDRMQPLVKAAPKLFVSFKKNIQKVLKDTGDITIAIKRSGEKSESFRKFLKKQDVK